MLLLWLGVCRDNFMYCCGWVSAVLTSCYWCSWVYVVLTSCYCCGSVCAVITSLVIVVVRCVPLLTEVHPLLYTR